MLNRVGAWVAVLSVAGLVAGCGDDRVATAHIRAVLAPGSTRVADSPVVELPNGDTLGIGPSVVAFYRARSFRPAWTDAHGLRPRGLRVLDALGSVNAEGLDRERYHYSTAHAMARLLEDDEVGDRTLAYLGNLDLLLTESFARLTRDLAAGTLDPREAGLEWRIPRGRAPERALIRQVVQGRDPQAVLATVRPRVPYYERMVHGLRRLRRIERKGGWGTVPRGAILRAGDRAPRVARLRDRLVRGVDPTERRLARAGRADPELFDDDLAAALEHFQTRHTLHEDGALGPKTVAALDVPVADRIDALRLNLDRWRWLPRDLGDTYVLVNVAGFELEVVDGDSAIESMDVVVGRTANRTPIFVDTLEYMVVNPYWNVPRSIAEKEILPKARRDPTYLDRHHFELVRDGHPVHRRSVTPAALESGRVRVRQRPGPDNALGHVKFLFPNRNHIYLHDTPADRLFSQESRAFSHGCIRLQRPDDLARTLLAALTDRPPSDYDALRREDTEQWIAFDEQIPVYILYFTAWVDADGALRFHPDIYHRDRSLEREQEAKLAPVRPAPIPETARG